MANCGLGAYGESGDDDGSSTAMERQKSGDLQDIEEESAGKVAYGLRNRAAALVDPGVGRQGGHCQDRYQLHEQGDSHTVHSILCPTLWRSPLLAQLQSPHADTDEEHCEHGAELDRVFGHPEGVHHVSDGLAPRWSQSTDRGRRHSSDLCEEDAEVDPEVHRCEKHHALQCRCHSRRRAPRGRLDHPRAHHHTEHGDVRQRHGCAASGECQLLRRPCGGRGSEVHNGVPRLRWPGPRCRLEPWRWCNGQGRSGGSAWCWRGSEGLGHQGRQHIRHDGAHADVEASLSPGLWPSHLGVNFQGAHAHGHEEGADHRRQVYGLGARPQALLPTFQVHAHTAVVPLASSLRQASS
mmetsp:Transcript_116909/g.249797  ORF Transcript_116909/g.249797 Transcript_116909/m.249797 type:complete len:352 (-) Transcript_116909:1618-2673(-)